MSYVIGFFGAVWLLLMLAYVVGCCLFVIGYTLALIYSVAKVILFGNQGPSSQFRRTK